LIDAERLEVKVLRGMKETIKRSPNLIIITEWVNFDEYSNVTMEQKK
jgi:hypothetical protein